MPPHRDEQSSAAPCFSPGLVRSEEIVLRTLLDPNHFNPDGTLATAAIPLDDIMNRGWSIARVAFTSQWRIKLFHCCWKKRKPEILGFYVLRIPVSDIRSLIDASTNEPDFVVVDTASFLDPAHAEVLLAKGNHSKGAARGFRTNLVQKLPKRITVSQAFGPTEKWGTLKGMFAQLRAILLAPVRCFRQIGS